MVYFSKYFSKTSLLIVYFSRDFTVQNIMLTDDGHLKIIDFGMAATCAPDERLRERVAQPSIWAPEVSTRHSYDVPGTTDNKIRI